MQNKDRQFESTQEVSRLKAILNLVISIDRRLMRIAEDITDNSSLSLINPQQTYTRLQAARLLSVSTWSIDRARKQGLLIEANRIGQRDVRITGESLLTFLTSRETATVQVRKL